MSTSDRTQYMRDYRTTIAGQAALMAQKRRDKARRAAIKELINRHEWEFNELFSVALTAVEEAFRTGND
ncbi:MAG: hypothetical protein ABW022_10965 [Actinoplanes sp.]